MSYEMFFFILFRFSICLIEILKQKKMCTCNIINKAFPTKSRHKSMLITIIIQCEYFFFKLVRLKNKIKGLSLLMTCNNIYMHLHMYQHHHLFSETKQKKINEHRWTTRFNFFSLLSYLTLCFSHAII